MKIVLGCLIFLGLISSSALATDMPTIWWSPNHQQQASTVLHHEPDHLDRNDLTWDVVSIKNAQGRILASLSLKEGSGIMRAGVTEALWSEDSRFFIFVTESSGGHSSWHAPAYVYDVTTSNIYSIDDTLGSVTADGTPLSISESDVLKIRFWDGSKEDIEPQRRTIDLRDFIKKGPKLALNFHHISHAPHH